MTGRSVSQLLRKVSVAPGNSETHPMRPAQGVGFVRACAAHPAGQVPVPVRLASSLCLTTALGSSSSMVERRNIAPCATQAGT